MTIFHPEGQMFTIQGPGGDLLKKNTVVMDSDTGLKLKLISMTQRSSGYAFLLANDEVSIPFEMSCHYYKDESSGRDYLLTRFEKFGRSLLVEDITGITPNSFSGEDEKLRWMRIAAEAVLIFGGAYNGPESPADRYRVELEGEVLTRKDFGYDD